ncbi:VENN motif pre-toxin domain-containing protein, partial [Stenotrophomonas maltophilia]
LTAGSLTFTDLQNHMDYTASSGSISGGAGGQMDGWAPKPGTAAPRGGPGLSMMEKGSDSSSTLATLTEGNITIGGKQTSAAELGINTDASGAHHALDALPDASKLLADQQAMAAAAGTVMATSQQIAWDVQAYQSKKATQAYYDGLSSDDKKAFNALSAEQRDAVLTANSQAYNDAKKWGDGGEYSRALSAVTTAVVGGVAGQGAGQVASNALAPYAAYFIGRKLDSNHGSDPNATLQLLSHAVLGALLAEANGGSAGTGAVSAAGGELAAKVLTNTLTGGDPSRLSPEQKEMVLALSQAVGALASGLSGQDLAGIALNAGIAKNSVENNYLSFEQRTAKDTEGAKCGKDDVCRREVEDRWADVSQGQSREMKDRYLSYLSEDERSVLFNLKPGTAAYDEIVALAVIRESGKSPDYGSIFARDVSLLRENDWVGALAGGMPGGMRLADRNRLEMAVLGPVFAMPSVLSTLGGASPETISLTNQIGSIAWDVAGAAVAFGPKSTSSRSGVTKDPAAVGGGVPQPKVMALWENPLLTDVKFSKGQTRYSADQAQTNISVGDAIRTLESNGYSRTVSKDGSVTVLQKGGNIYRFYPKSSSDGVPSASLTISGQKKPVLKIRFVGSENGK